MNIRGLGTVMGHPEWAEIARLGCLALVGMSIMTCSGCIAGTPTSSNRVSRLELLGVVRAHPDYTPPPAKAPFDTAASAAEHDRRTGPVGGAGGTSDQRSDR